MKKIRLEIDTLVVESFAADAAAAARGTVDANEVTFAASCTTCNGCSSRPNPCFCTEAASCNCN